MAEVPRHRLGDLERNLQLIAFMSENDLMNYFDLQTSLHELSLGGQLLRERVPGDDRYALTPEGEEAIGLFMQRLVSGAVERVRSAAPEFRERMRRERELFARISHAGQNQYHTQAGITEGGMDLLRLDISLPTAELAERFRAAWPERAREIYDFILARLSGEDLP